MEKAYFPMEYYRLTQGYGNKSSSHKYIYALDLGGKDTGKDKIFAPFTGTIKKIYDKPNVAKTIWIESNEPVICANGETTYLTMLLAHDDDVTNLYVGKVIKQGEYFLDEGRSGLATGNHIHIELSNKKFSKTGWFKNKQNVWQINDPVKPEEYLFLKQNTIVLNDIYNNVRYEIKQDNNFTYQKEILIAYSNLVFNANLTKEEYVNTLNKIKNWSTDEIAKF